MFGKRQGPLTRRDLLRAGGALAGGFVLGSARRLLAMPPTVTAGGAGSAAPAATPAPAPIAGGAAAGALRHPRRLIFLSHPYAWECQIQEDPSGADKPRASGLTPRQFLEFERKVSSQWPDQIRHLGPDDVMVMNRMGGQASDTIDGPLGPAWRAGLEHLGDRFLVTRDPAGESYGHLVAREFVQRGYVLDGSRMAAEGWGQSFEGCLARWAASLGAALDIPGGVPIRYEMAVPDAVHALKGTFIRRVDWPGSNLCLYVYSAEDGRPFGIFLPTRFGDHDPARYVRIEAAPEQLEFSTIRREPVQVPHDGTAFSLPLRLNKRSIGLIKSPYVWSVNMDLAQFEAVLSSARLVGHGLSPQ